ncbi:hypothetical protein pb186bvf_019272 [Paramecium bursaria]
MTSTSELIKSLLEDHDCVYDDNVVYQLNEYAFRLMKTIINQSSEIADQSKRNNINVDDIRMAIDNISNPSVNQQDMIKFQKQKNEQLIKEGFDPAQQYGGIILTQSDLNKLSKPNYQVITQMPDNQDNIEFKPPKQEDLQASKAGRKKIKIVLQNDQDME